LKIKQYDKTINVINVAYNSFPENYELKAQEANSYLMKGDTINAIKNFEEAYKLNPNQNLARFLQKKYLENGDTLNSIRFR
jgi:tetratricopeptide (TPR) repeat protein